MFSWRYALRALGSAVRNPGSVLKAARGQDPGAGVFEKRMAEWGRTRGKYADRPKRTHGFEMYLNPDDMSQISALIATSGWLDPPVTCLLMAKLRAGMQVVDVGANLGYYTLLAARSVGGSGKVWSFEPEPLNFGLLSKSIRANGFRNVETIQMALADKGGPRSLFLAPQGEPNAHTLTLDRGVGSLEVASISLDEFWRSKDGPRLDVLKVHVFGDEPIVLSGATRVLEAQRPMVVTRYGSERWTEYPRLLDAVYDWYDVYEFVDSPRLIRQIPRSELVPGVHRGLFWKPKGG